MNETLPPTIIVDDLAWTVHDEIDRNLLRTLYRLFRLHSDRKLARQIIATMLDMPASCEPYRPRAVKLEVIR